MSEKILLNETLSALLDNEAGKTDALELRRLARAMETDPELIGRYQRYLLGSAVMRSDAITISTDFLGRVQKGIDADAGSAQRGNNFARSEKPYWLKVAGQFAVAASVAVMAIIYVQTNRLPESPLVAETATLTEGKKLGDNTDNRMLNPRVLTVSAGSGFVDAQQKRGSAHTMTDCVIVERELPVGSGLRPLQLPEGYVLCRMDENHQRCHAVSTTLACSPR